ncbi:hypothetical protein D3260_08450 [Salinisphaera sp. Q1T1-3]|nr:hypothetical protein D3260_08450 [Salinisphaera sp. Q1T1-3]
MRCHGTRHARMTWSHRARYAIDDIGADPAAAELRSDASTTSPAGPLPFGSSLPRRHIALRSRQVARDGRRLA